MMQKFDQFAPLIIALGSFGLLGGAWIGQYGFDLYPCVLCMTQRMGHYIAIPLALVSYWMWRQDRLWFLPMLITMAALLHSSGYGLFHTGVEQGWWQGTEACAGSFVETSSIEERLKQLSAGGAARCDEVPWSLFGISMAGYNFLFSGALVALAGLAIWRRWSHIKNSQ